MTTAIKFNLHNVTNGTDSARVSYSKQTYQGVTTVTLYAKDYKHGLCEIFGADVYSNYTDTQSDLFDQGKVTLTSEHPLFAAACAAADRRAAAHQNRTRRTTTSSAVVVHTDEVNEARTSRTVSAICGKVGVAVVVYSWGVTVAVVGKTRFGKHYRSLAAARREYRSPEVLAILDHVATTKPRLSVRAVAVEVAA